MDFVARQTDPAFAVDRLGERKAFFRLQCRDHVKVPQPLDLARRTFEPACVHDPPPKHLIPAAEAQNVTAAPDVGGKVDVPSLRPEMGKVRDCGFGAGDQDEVGGEQRGAREGGDAVILGAPNVSRGGSHKGNVSAAELVRLGLCDALASDYHYPSLRRAALRLWRDGICDIATAWALVSDGPARLLGLDDRGRLAPGQRADIVLLDKATLRVAATLCAGRVSYLNGALAARFLA